MLFVAKQTFYLGFIQKQEGKQAFQTTYGWQH